MIYFPKLLLDQVLKGVGGVLARNKGDSGCAARSPFSRADWAGSVLMGMFRAVGQWLDWTLRTGAENRCILCKIHLILISDHHKQEFLSLRVQGTFRVIWDVEQFFVVWDSPELSGTSATFDSGLLNLPVTVE